MDQLPSLITLIFFYELLSVSYIYEIWFLSRAQSEAFQAIFVLCLYETHSFILSIILNWSIEGNISLHLAYAIVHNASYHAIQILDVMNKWSETAGAQQFKFFAIMNTVPKE